MKKILNIISVFFKAIIELALAGVSFYLLFNLSWIFGHQLLDSQALIGNDSDFALSLVSWFDRWWPRIPLWYPLQGAGVSLFHSYPMLTTFLVIVLKNITSLTNTEVFRILSFSVFPLTAFGVYALARRKTGHPIAAFFAGVFFLLSQASWVFIRLHGIFAQSFSMIFVPWSFLFFDIFLTRKTKHKKNDFIARSAAFLTVIFTTLIFLTHVVTGTVVVLSLFAYAFFSSQFLLPLKTGIKKRIHNLFLNTGLAVFCVVLTFCLAAFWLMPFFSYNRLANREGLLNMGMNQLKEVSLLPRTLAGFGDFAVGSLRYDFFFFALPVILLALIGLAGSALNKRSVLSWGLIAFGAALFTGLPLYLPFLVSLFQYLFTAVYFRALTATIILLPVVAGFGVFFLVDWPFSAFESLAKKKLAEFKGMGWVVVKSVLKAGRWLVIFFWGLAVGLFFIIRFEHQPPPTATTAQPAYGISAFKAYGPTLGEDIEILKKDWRIIFKKPDIKVSKGGPIPAPSLLGFINDFQLDKTSRVDVSAYSGESFLQRAPLVTEASFVNLYHYFASLIHRMWGYQQGVFYGHEPIYDNPALLKELSYWFGIEYTVIVPGFDREDNYKKTGWELVKEGGGVDSPLPVYHFPEAEGLLTTTDRPAALVIGNFEKEAYDQVFRSSNAGAFSYKDLWLAEGGLYLDDYSLKELSEFDLLILHGYGYKNKAKAWSLINKFVEEGGKVFLDTGWQYVSSDWGSKTNGEAVLPEPAPAVRTVWGKVSPQWSDFTLDPMFGKLEVGEFKPFLWEGNPWGAALAKEKQLREGSQVLIKDKDNNIVLAKRDFGKGAIVWSGLNLFSHAQGPEGEKEIGILKAVFDTLIDKKSYEDTIASWQRDYPDDLSIKLDKSNSRQWLLWREAFTPNWSAYFKAPEDDKAKSLKIYRGGPGFVLIKLPEINKETTLRLNYRLRFLDSVFAKSLSILTALILVIYLFAGNKMETIIKRIINSKFGKHYEKIKNNIASGEDDY